jgi:ABC-type Fe3+-siderophore transport system permease subunit
MIIPRQTGAGRPNHQRLLPVSLSWERCSCCSSIISAGGGQHRDTIGILTAIVGVPFFVYLLRRSDRGWA